MIGKLRVIAVIPARGGSKGLPGKNIRPLCGKPLLAWSIEACRTASYLDEIMVTTDCERIAAVAREHGAAVPFLRPAELASDTATTFAAVEHALRHYDRELGRRFDLLVLVEPTSPLREPKDIEQAVEMLAGAALAEAVVSVCACESVHPVFMATRDAEGFLRSYLGPAMSAARRQDVEAVYFPEGTVYAARVEAYLRRKTFYHERTLGYVVPKWKAPEVDDLHDWVVVEALLRHRLAASEPRDEAESRKAI